MRILSLLLVIPMAACGTSDPKGCTTRLGGEVVFVGEARCLAKLPQEELSGYWVSGHEYSVFYANQADIRREPDAQALWLFLSSEAEDAAREKLRAGEWQVFAIRFIGMKSTARGVYGPGPFRGGVLVARVLQLQEVDTK